MWKHTTHMATWRITIRSVCCLLTADILANLLHMVTNKIHTPLDLMQLSALDGHLICKWNIHCLGLFEAKFMK